MARPARRGTSDSRFSRSAASAWRDLPGRRLVDQRATLPL